MVRLCESLGLATVAEGVKTQAQFEVLRGLGVRVFQGFWFARPQPIDTWQAGLATVGTDRIDVLNGLERAWRAGSSARALTRRDRVNCNLLRV